MKDFTRIQGKKSIDNVNAMEKGQADPGSDLSFDPDFMHKTIGNRAVQFLVESQMFIGARQRAANNDFEIPDVNYEKEEQMIGEDREALKGQIKRAMKNRADRLHSLMEEAPGEKIYVNVTTDLVFAVVRSNIETGVFYEKMLLEDVTYSVEDLEYTEQARKEKEDAVNVRQVFSFEFDEAEFADLMPAGAAAGGAVAEDRSAQLEDDNADSDDDSKDRDKNEEQKGETVIAEVIEDAKKKII